MYFRFAIDSECYETQLIERVNYSYSMVSERGFLSPFHGAQKSKKDKKVVICTTKVDTLQSGCPNWSAALGLFID